jgi:hypothetical protein
VSDDFNFKRDDEYIRTRLTAEEINGVTRWQGKYEYQFSFHDGHPLGWPVYYLERTGRDLPKINLRPYTGALLNGDYIADKVGAGPDFKKVIAENVVVFTRLAELYYEGVEEEPEEIPLVDTWVVVYKCGMDKSKQPFTVKVKLNPKYQQAQAEAIWPNLKNRGGYSKPICKVHKNNRCMVDTVAKLQPTEAAQLKYAFKKDGRIKDLTLPKGQNIVQAWLTT